MPEISINHRNEIMFAYNYDLGIFICRNPDDL